MNFTSLNSNRRRNSQNGFTLLELLVVVVVLVATAVIVLPLFTTSVEIAEGERQSAKEIATTATMNVVREAMTGEQGVYENLGHKPEALPRDIKDLVEKQPPEHLQQLAPELSRYDPVYRVGWHGPYLMPTGIDPAGKSTLVDGWGNELVIQVDFDGDGKINRLESEYMRVVSPGPNGQLETPEDVSNMVPGTNQQSELTRSECGDDVVVFIRVPDSRQ